MDRETASIDRSGRPDRAEALRRLRWRARRGLLENDLLIEGFLDQQGDLLEPAQLDALALLLDCSEAELFDLLMGRCEPGRALDGPALREVLQRLRTIRLQPLGPRTSLCTPGA